VTITYRPIERWPRDFTRGRRRSPFKAAFHSTFRLLERELAHAGAKSAVVQLALDQSQFRISDGKPYANATPSHPGVIVSFNKGKLPLAFPCDRYLTWVENLRAIALALDALRRVDRYGVTQHAEQYRGWNALPPATPIITPPTMTVEDAARFVGNEGGPVPWGDVMRSPDTFKASKRRASLKYHPDQNNGTERHEWHTLQAAVNVLEKHHAGAL
jgi:hypothetical protein